MCECVRERQIKSVCMSVGVSGVIQCVCVGKRENECVVGHARAMELAFDTSLSCACA